MLRAYWIVFTAMLLIALLPGCRSGGGIDGGQTSAQGPRIKWIAPLSWPAQSEAQFTAVVEGASPISYQWGFGAAATPSSSSNAAPTVMLGAVGDYDVTLTVGNALGSDTYTYSLHSIGYMVSGSVHTYDGKGVQGVTLYFDGGLEPAMTDVDGRWWRNDIAAGAHTVTPSRGDWTFDPPSREFAVDGAEAGGLWFTFTGTECSAENWVHTWTAHEAGQAVDVAADRSGNVYVLGSDTQIVKYSPSGQLIWSKDWIAPQNLTADYGDFAYSMVADEADSLYICGSRGSSGDDSQYYLIRMSDTGNLLWQKRFAGMRPYDIAFCQDHLYIAGLWNYGSYPRSPALLVVRSSGTYVDCVSWPDAQYGDVRAVAVDTEGNAYLAGSTSEFGTRSSAAYVMSFDGDRQVRWTSIWEGWDDNDARGICVDAAGNTYTAVAMEDIEFAGPRATALVSYSADGALRWNRAWPDASGSYYYCPAVCLGIADNVYLTWKLPAAPGSSYGRYGLLDVRRSGEPGLLMSLTHPSGITPTSLVQGPAGELILAGSAPNASCFWETAVADEVEFDGLATSIQVEVETQQVTLEDMEWELRDCYGHEDVGDQVGNVTCYNPGTLLTAKRTP